MPKVQPPELKKFMDKKLSRKCVSCWWEQVQGCCGPSVESFHHAALRLLLLFCVQSSSMPTGM